MTQYETQVTSMIRQVIQLLTLIRDNLASLSTYLMPFLMLLIIFAIISYSVKGL